MVRPLLGACVSPYTLQTGLDLRRLVEITAPMAVVSRTGRTAPSPADHIGRQASAGAFPVSNRLSRVTQITAKSRKPHLGPLSQ